MQKIISHRVECNDGEAVSALANRDETGLGWDIMTGFGGRMTVPHMAETVADWVGQVHGRQKDLEAAQVSATDGFWQAFAHPDGPGA